MAININNLNQNNQVSRTVQQQTERQSQVANDAAKSTQSTKVAQDSVSLTPQAKQMSELQKKNGDAQPVNQKKVEELKAAIQSGYYKVDAEKLAESITKFEFDLI
ncbi:flagellar biosynthesis anti-sigma factor FlgM [Thalassotalea euphylliae]|uniref:flagellar biosynthesis anti-sigma factor FlgM n=1 Tax=Thalassotalea euphylliae TaxID=1655234 RepID=UPI0036450382